MSNIHLNTRVKKLDDYKVISRIFGTGYLRKIDKIIQFKHKNCWLLVNTYFAKDVLETSNPQGLSLLEIFTEPIPFIVFLKKISNKFKINFSHPKEGDLEKLATLFAAARQFIKYRFVVKESFNEYRQLEEMRKEFIEKPQCLSVAYIIPSLDCNFRCPGCFIYRKSWEKKHSGTMRPEVFDHMHEFIMRFLPKHLPIEFSYIFYGGEPLLNKPFIEYASHRIQVLKSEGVYGKLKPRLGIVTNGSLIDEDSIRIFKKYHIIVSISLDGVGASNDANRIFPGGIGTFKTVLKGIRLLEDAKVKYGLSWTIGPSNIDSTARDIKWVVKHLKTREISFNIMQDMNGNLSQKMEESKYFKKMHRIYDVLRENNIIEGRLMRYRFAGKKRSTLLPYPFYCAAVGGGQFVLRPDGKIGICHAGLMQREEQWQTPEQIIDIFHDPVYLKWFARTPVFIKKCYQDCNYFSLCAGGCAYQVEKATGSMYDRIKNVCMVERFFMERAIIEDHSEKSKKS